MARCAEGSSEVARVVLQGAVDLANQFNVRSEVRPGSLSASSLLARLGWARSLALSGEDFGGTGTVTVSQALKANLRQMPQRPQPMVQCVESSAPRALSFWSDASRHQSGSIGGNARVRAAASSGGAFKGSGSSRLPKWRDSSSKTPRRSETAFAGTSTS